VKIAIFGSGKGSNAEKLIEYYSDSSDIEVALIVSNKSNAGILDIAKDAKINTYIISSDEGLLDKLKSENIQFIVLAGYLKKISNSLIQQFESKIINIHPALLPKYGGKGMYGIHIHKKVVENEEKESGITVHLVNENYDEGRILFQKALEVKESWDAETLASEILKIEHYWFPRVVEKYICELQPKEVLIGL
jgi:phosphoribosylglycinamide formyltransferase-1